MKKAALGIVFVILLASSAMAQTVVQVGSSILTSCQDTETGATTATCSLTWNDPSGLAEGAGSATAVNGYSLLQAFVSDSATTTSSSYGSAAETQSIAGMGVVDDLTFAGLSTGAFLRETLKVSGTSSGDLGFALVNGIVYAQNGSQPSVNCKVDTLKGSCTLEVAISPGDSIHLTSNFQISAKASVPAQTQGGDGVTLNYYSGSGKAKGNGATIALEVVDGHNNPLHGVTIVAGSGTIYPTK
jgi:hypothetical protein